MIHQNRNLSTIQIELKPAIVFPNYFMIELRRCFTFPKNPS